MSGYLARLVGRALGSGAPPQPIQQVARWSQSDHSDPAGSNPPDEAPVPASSDVGEVEEAVLVGVERDLPSETQLQKESPARPTRRSPRIVGSRVERRPREQPTTTPASGAAGVATRLLAVPELPVSLDSEPALGEPTKEETAPRTSPVAPEPVGGRLRLGKPLVSAVMTSSPRAAEAVPVRPRLPAGAGKDKALSPEGVAARAIRQSPNRPGANPAEPTDGAEVEVHIGTVEIKAVPPPRSSRAEPADHPAGFDGYRLMRSYFIRGG